MNAWRTWIVTTLALILALTWSNAASAKTSQTITFGTLSNQTYGASPFSVSATASSGLAVTFTSATTAVCTVSGTNGTTVTLVAAGTCKIDANQSGNFTYSAAPQVAQSFTVAQEGQTITFGAIANQNLSTFPLTISATASSGLTVAFTSNTTSICTVSGTTVSLIAIGTCTIAANQTGNTDFNAAPTVLQSFSIVAFCAAPANIASGVTVSCVCDNFGRTTLNPSTIYGSNWIVSTSDQTGILPSIVNQGYLQLTSNTGNNAKAATVNAIFPASGNYISVEFQHYAYDSTSGTGADGMAVTLSDYSTPAVPGAFGGSLGYAQKTGTACNTLPTTPCNGFAGGWIGVGFDEFGNYQNATEGRIGGPGAISESVGLRGSGSGTNGYNYLAGTSSLSPTVDDASSSSPEYGYYYQVIVDARNAPTSTAVTVNRNTGSGYASLISVPNVFTTATAQGFTQAAVPANWQISFTGSTGGDNNIHAIGGLRICAQTIEPSTGGTPGSFNAIDSAYGTPSVSPVPVQDYLSGHIYMKLAGQPFALNVAAMNNSQILTTYAETSAKTVTVNLVANVVATDGFDCTQAASCTSQCTSKPKVEAGATQSLTYAAGATNQGQQQSGNFTLNNAYPRLVAIMSDGTTSACSTDSFSVRPLNLAVSATTSGGTALATSLSATATPTVNAGGNFIINAASGTVGYNGTPLLTSSNGNYLNATDYVSGAALPTAMLTGSFGAAVASTGTASGNFQYNDVGYFEFAANTVTDPNFTVTDQGSYNDCISGSTSTTISNGKYGCTIGSSAAYQGGRFIPDHFVLSSPSIVNRSEFNSGAGPTNVSSFTYMGESLGVQFNLTAQNAANKTTLNYVNNAQGDFQRLAQDKQDTVIGAGPAGTYGNLALWGIGSGYTVGTGTCTVSFAHVATSGSYGTTFGNCVGGAVAPTAIACSTGGTNCSGGPRIIAAAPTISNFASGAGTVTTNLTIERADSPDGPYATFNIGAAPMDADGVTLLNSALNLDTDNGGGGTFQRQLLGSEPLYYGRLKLGNAYGSELLPLWVPVTAQYIKGFTSVSPSLSGPIFVTNTLDNATSFSPTSNLSIGDYTGTLSASNLTVAGNISSNLYKVGSGATITALAGGQANIEVKPPTAGASIPTGSAFIALTLGSSNTNENCVLPALANATSGASLSYLQWGWWCSGKLDPNALITFGTPVNRFIYLRENY